MFYCKNWGFCVIQSVLSVSICLEYYSNFSPYLECCSSRHLFKMSRLSSLALPMCVRKRNVLLKGTLPIFHKQLTCFLLTSAMTKQGWRSVKWSPAVCIKVKWNTLIRNTKFIDVERRVKLGYLKNSSVENRSKQEGRIYHRIWKGQFQTLKFRQDFLIRLSKGDRMKKNNGDNDENSYD